MRARESTSTAVIFAVNGLFDERGDVADGFEFELGRIRRMVG